MVKRPVFNSADSCACCLDGNVVYNDGLWFQQNNNDAERFVRRGDENRLVVVLLAP